MCGVDVCFGCICYVCVIVFLFDEYFCCVIFLLLWYVGIVQYECYQCWECSFCLYIVVQNYYVVFVLFDVYQCVVDCIVVVVFVEVCVLWVVECYYVQVRGQILVLLCRGQFWLQCWELVGGGDWQLWLYQFFVYCR